MKPTYYSAAWTDSGRFFGCPHEHETIVEAASCIPRAGGYVVGVENAVMRSLSPMEESEFQAVIRDTLKYPPPYTAVPAAGAEQASGDSGYAVMTRIRVLDHWTWATWMCFDTYAQAVAHARRGDKVVRFSSEEWAALKQEKWEAPPQQTDAASPIHVNTAQETLPSRVEGEPFVDFVLRLPNRRAFDEAGRALAVAMCDVDGLKALNDFAYDAGNALLKAKADALREAGLEAYHDKGDEFLCRGDNTKELQANLERARAVLRNRTVIVQRADGRSLSFTGADFSYGVGKDINEAELLLKRHKTERESRGEIARGELRGITIKRSEPKDSPLESDTFERLPALSP
jgi:GGDEF domain-containing protein